MDRKTALGLSVIFHPFLLTLAGAALLLWVHPTFSLLLTTTGKWSLLGLLFINTALIPVLGILMLKNMGIVSSLQLPGRKERRWPFLMGVGAYAITVYLLSRAGFPSVMIRYLVAATLVLTAGGILNFFFKISLHGLGTGAASAILLKLALTQLPGLLWFFPLALALSGLVGSARLSLQAHQPYEFYLGFLTGFTIPILFF